MSFALLDQGSLHPVPYMCHMVRVRTGSIPGAAYDSMSCGVSTYVRTVWTRRSSGVDAGSGAVAPVPLYRVWLARCRVEVDGEMSPVKPGPAADATVMQV